MEIKQIALQIKIDELKAERSDYISGEQINVDDVNVRMSKVMVITNELERLWDELQAISEI